MKIGDKFFTENYGELSILSIEGCKKITVKFTETGYETVTSSSNILTGRVKDPMHPSIFGVGFFGVGDYRFSKGDRGKIVRLAYSKWSSMLRRCYGKDVEIKFPTYKGCTVSSSWHNFQNFAKWFDDNYKNDGISYDLDKDIKVKGNKEYGPDTCMLVTRFENVSESSKRTLAKEYEFLSPTGEVVKIKNLSEFCRKMNLDASKMSMVNSGKRNNHFGWRSANGNV